MNDKKALYHRIKLALDFIGTSCNFIREKPLNCSKIHVIPNTHLPKRSGGREARNPIIIPGVKKRDSSSSR